MINKLSNKKRYEIADKLAKAFKPSMGKLCEQPRDVQFGIIINKRFSNKGKVVCLKDVYSLEISMHITNLILMRLCDEDIVEVDL